MLVELIIVLSICLVEQELTTYLRQSVGEFKDNTRGWKQKLIKLALDKYEILLRLPNKKSGREEGAFY